MDLPQTLPGVPAAGIDPTIDELAEIVTSLDIVNWLGSDVSPRRPRPRPWGGASHASATWYSFRALNEQRWSMHLRSPFLLPPTARKPNHAVSPPLNMFTLPWSGVLPGSAWASRPTKLLHQPLLPPFPLHLWGPRSRSCCRPARGPHCSSRQAVVGSGPNNGLRVGSASDGRGPAHISGIPRQTWRRPC